MTQANESDALITARGKAEVNFVVNGVESTREIIRNLTQTVETATQKVANVRARLNSAIDAQVKAELRLSNLQALNAKQADAITQSEIRYANALVAVQQAQEKATVTQTNLDKAKGNYLVTQEEYNRLLDLNDAAQTKLIAREMALERATILADNARLNSVRTLQGEVAAQGQLAAATERVNDLTLKLKQAEENAAVAGDKLKGSTQGLTNSLNGTSDAQKKLADKTKETVDSKKRLESALGTLRSSLSTTTGGLLSTSGAASGVSSALSGISAAGLALGSVVTVVVALVAAVAGLATASIDALNSYKQLTGGIQQFVNSTGASAQSASVFNLVARSVGKTSQDLSITLGSLYSNLFKLGNEFDKAGNKSGAAIQKIDDRIANLNLDRLQALKRAAEDLALALNEIDINRRQAVEQNKFTTGQRTEDFNANKGTINTNLFETLQELARRANEQLESLAEDHASKLADIQSSIEEAKTDARTDELKAQQDLTDKLLALDQKYADKKLSLQEKYFSSSPLLRPYLKAAIDNLEVQKKAEQDSLKDKAQIEQEKIRRDNEAKIRALEERIAKENRLYEQQVSKIIADRLREEKEASISAQRRLAELERNYAQETAAAKRNLDKQLADYQQQQERLIAANKLKLDRIEEEYKQALARIKTGEDELLAKPTAAEETPLASALRKLGINFEELRKLKPEEQLLAIARALESYNGPDKAAIVSIIAGLFGVDSVNFLKALAQTKGSLDDITKSAQALYPDLILTETQLQKAFETGIKLQQIGLIFDNLKARLATGLLPIVNDVADGILKWYSDPENRQKLFDFVDNFTAAVRRIYEILKNIVTGNFSLDEILKNFFDVNIANKTGEDFGKALGKAAVNAISYIVNGIADAINLLADTPRFIAAVINFFAKFNSSLASFGLGLIKGIADGIIEAIPNLKASLQKVIDAVVGLDWEKIIRFISPVANLLGTIKDAAVSLGAAVPPTSANTAGGTPVVITPIAPRSSSSSTSSLSIDNINMTFTSPNVNGQQVLDELKDAIKRKGVGN